MSHRPHTDLQRQRRKINRQAIDVAYLFRPIANAIGVDVLTTSEVIERLSQHPGKQVRRALLVLTDDGVLTRVSDSQTVLYARSSTTPEEGSHV